MLDIKDVTGKPIEVGDLILHASAYSGSVGWSRGFVDKLHPYVKQNQRPIEVIELNWQNRLASKRLSPQNVVVIGKADREQWVAEQEHKAAARRKR